MAFSSDRDQGHRILPWEAQPSCRTVLEPGLGTDARVYLGDQVCCQPWGRIIVFDLIGQLQGPGRLRGQRMAVLWAGP